MRRFLIALAIGGMMGAVVGSFLKAGGLSLAFPGSSVDMEGAADGADSGTIENSVAWHYVRACQEGDWARVMAFTPWVQERLQYVQETEGAEAVERERDALMATFGARTLDENYLKDTGVEDQYVFTPGARVTFSAVDTGRADLEKPVARRTWFLVEFPAREKALLDGDSIPIRSLRAGVNVSHDGFVLKASIIGNLDIDWASIRYDWPSP